MEGDEQDKGGRLERIEEGGGRKEKGKTVVGTELKEEDGVGVGKEMEGWSVLYNRNNKRDRLWK